MRCEHPEALAYLLGREIGWAVLPHGIFLVLGLLEEGFYGPCEAPYVLLPLLPVQVRDPRKPPYHIPMSGSSEVHPPYLLIKRHQGLLHLPPLHVAVELGELRVPPPDTICIGHHIGEVPHSPAGHLRVPEDLLGLSVELKVGGKVPRAAGVVGDAVVHQGLHHLLLRKPTGHPLAERYVHPHPLALYFHSHLPSSLHQLRKGKFREEVLPPHGRPYPEEALPGKHHILRGLVMGG